MADSRPSGEPYFYLRRDRLKSFRTNGGISDVAPGASSSGGGGWRPWSFLSGCLSAFACFHRLAARER